MNLMEYLQSYARSVYDRRLRCNDPSSFLISFDLRSKRLVLELQCIPYCKLSELSELSEL